MNPEIKKYISDAKEKGLEEKEIRSNLKSAGWDEASINSAFGEKVLEVPKPSSTSSNHEEYRHLSNPLNSILYIINFVLLLTALFSGMLLLNNAVDYYVPDKVINTTDVYGGGVNTTYDQLFNSATISFAFFAVSLPLYLLITAFLRNDESKKIIIRKSWARKISYFLIIFNSFVICVGAPVWTLYILISGDFSFGVLLKFFANFLFNIFPLIYYFLQLRDDKKIFG